MQPIVNMSSKKRRCLLKTDFARVTKLRIMAALLVATVVIGMPFSVEAFVATSQTINDTYVIINEDLPTTNLPHQGFFTKTQYRKAFVSLLRNQATIVKKLNNLASEVSLIKNDLGLQKFQGSHDFKSRDMHHHKPFNENTKARKENKVMKHLDEINEKLMVLLYLQRERNLDNSDNHKSSNTPSSQTYSGHEPHSRTRRSSVYVPDTFAFSTPVFNTHIPSLNMDPGYIESNHIDPNPQNSYTGGYGASLPRVQPSVNSGSSFTSTYGDNSELNSVYDDPQPMYGPLYDRNSMLYKTAYPDTSLPGTSYQEPSLRFDSLFDSQQTSSFGSVVRDSSYYSPQLGQSSNSESEESSRNAAYLEAHSDDAQRLSHGMKSMLQELLSLVRWLVRKKHQTQSSQNSYITSIQHTLNQRLTSIEGSIIGAMTTQTQDILQSTHQIGHEIRLETADFNFHNLSQIILEAVSNITSEREVTSIEKCITNTANEIGAERPNDLDNAVNEFKEETLETANSRRTDDIQAATVASDKHTYHLSDINQENIEVSGLNSYDDISSNKNKKGPIWEVFSFSDFLSNPSDDSSLEPESSMRIQHLETSGTDNNATSTSIIDTTETVFDSINATDEERLRMSLKSINPRSATQAANILVLATELLKNASSTHQSSRQVESSPPCVPVNQTELVRSFTNEFQVFLEELKTKLGHSLSQNLAEDSLELVLSRLLGPSVQRLEERMLGVQIYLDAAVLKLRHEFEAAITTSEASLNSSLTNSMTSIVRNAVDEALLTARETALQIADATVTSVSSAAVASGHHSSDLLTGVIKRSATQVKNSIRQSVGGCPQHFTSLGGLCLKVPSIAPPVPFAPVHYSPTFTPTSNVPPATSYNWTQARAICRSYDGDLAVVPEFHDLTKIFRSLNTGSGEGFWLGAKRKSVTEGETPDQPEARVKLKWITGEFSEFDSELKQKMSFKSPFVTVSQNVLFNSADGVTVIPYTDSQECLLLRTAHSLVLEVTDCGALHKPLCQFIPTL